MSDWRDKAACREEDPELFFPIGTTGHAVLQIDEAKAVCQRCEVTETCLRWALDTGQDAGVWGGLAEDERRTLRRRNARARAKENPRPRQDVAPAAKAPREPATVPAQATLEVIAAARETGKSWRDIGRLLNASDSTCREVHAGTRTNVARATEATARTLLEQMVSPR